MKNLIVYCLICILYSCQSIFQDDVEPSGIRWDECEADFSIEARFKDGQWVFNASSTTSPLYYVYWTLDGCLCEEHINDVKNVHLALEQDGLSEVCMVYMDAEGCHKACVVVDPAVRDFESFSQVQL